MRQSREFFSTCYQDGGQKAKRPTFKRLSLSNFWTNNLPLEIHVISNMVLWRMAIKVRRRLRFSWHKKKHAETATYCGLQARCTLHTCNAVFDVEVNPCNKSREAKLFPQMTLRENRWIRTKPRISEGMQNYHCQTTRTMTVHRK